MLLPSQVGLLHDMTKSDTATFRCRTCRMFLLSWIVCTVALTSSIWSRVCTDWSSSSAPCKHQASVLHGELSCSTVQLSRCYWVSPDCLTLISNTSHEAVHNISQRAVIVQGCLRIKMGYAWFTWKRSCNAGPCSEFKASVSRWMLLQVHAVPSNHAMCLQVPYKPSCYIAKGYCSHLGRQAAA